MSDHKLQAEPDATYPDWHEQHGGKLDDLDTEGLCHAAFYAHGAEIEQMQAKLDEYEAVPKLKKLGTWTIEFGPSPQAREKMQENCEGCRRSQKSKIPFIGPGSREADDAEGKRMKYPVDIIELARECGYAWPVDDAARINVLVGITRTVRHWRRERNEALSGVARERMYKHLLARNRALAKRLRNVKHAASRYRCMQNFEVVLAADTGGES